jgi:hypothetical protein
MSPPPAPARPAKPTSGPNADAITR